MTNADDSLFDLDIRVSSFEASHVIPDRPATDPNRDQTCNASNCDGTCDQTCATCPSCVTCADTCTCVPPPTCQVYVVVLAFS